jgi:hypothetical protein
MTAGERPFIEVSDGRQAAASARRLPANSRLTTLAHDQQRVPVRIAEVEHRG